jgi:ABC-2 type transport system permease protein
MKKIKIYLQYYLQCIQLAFQREMIYRINFLLIMIFEMLMAVSSILFIEIIYRQVQGIGGWTKYELFMLYGTYFIQNQLFLSLCIGGIISFSEKLRYGNLDFILLKPLSFRFMALFSEVNFTQIFSMLLGVYMVIYGMIRLGITPSLTEIAMYLFFLINGIVILINLFSMVICLSFWVVEVSRLVDMLSLFTGYAKEPKEIFSHAVTKFVFTLIIPLALITNPGVKVLLRHNQEALLLGAVCCSVITSVAAGIFWKISIKKYESASS